MTVGQNIGKRCFACGEKFCIPIIVTIMVKITLWAPYTFQFIEHINVGVDGITPTFSIKAEFADRWVCDITRITIVGSYPSCYSKAISFIPKNISLVKIIFIVTDLHLIVRI